MRRALRAVWRGLRFVVQTRHDAVSWAGIVAVTSGVGSEFGKGWALIAFGLVALGFAWKGLS